MRKGFLIIAYMYMYVLNIMMIELYAIGKMSVNASIYIHLHCH